MSAPVRWQRIGGVKFYRLGRTLIAESGTMQFIVHHYTNGGWEARWQPMSGLRMPIGGDVLPTLREAIQYLQPGYENAQRDRVAA